MKEIGKIFLKAIMITAVASCVGIAVNLLSPKGIPFIYVPPEEIQLSGVKVPLIDEKTAYRYFSDETTVFVDTRGEEDYNQGRVKGAIRLSSSEKEAQFPVVQPLLPEESRLILYCHGPDCRMAEKVADFLAQMGYKNMMVMVAGYPAWEDAGYPVEKSAEE